ncbi:MAG: hypothetical protein WEG36_13125 [Gemmatimonadota bacterium]
MFVILPPVGGPIRHGPAFVTGIHGIVCVSPMRILLVRERLGGGLMVHIPIAQLADHCLGLGAEQRGENDKCEGTTHLLESRS